MPIKEREAYNAYQRKWRSENRRATHSHNLKNRYGITMDEYDAMLAAQGGVCKLCNRPPKKKRLHVDHCHYTKRIRGLLCAHCNHKAIGAIEALGIYRVLEYLNYEGLISIRQANTRLGEQYATEVRQEPIQSTALPSSLV